MNSIEIFEEKLNALGLIEVKVDLFSSSVNENKIRMFTLQELEDDYYICDTCSEEQTVNIFSFRMAELRGRRKLVPERLAYEGEANETAMKILEKTVIATRELYRQERKKILEEL